MFNVSVAAGRPPAVLLAATLFVMGCGSDSEYSAPIDVSGKVSFQGQPVERGEITFEDPSTGAATSAPLAEGGAYELQVPAGTYQVGITPPTVMGKASPDTPADFVDYEKVNNIPQRYYWGGESRLSANVSKESFTHDFDMKP
jgi:hypothetical protein